ncbi:MAG: T9SS type A sorting domain-containing protein [Salibacteraceae bacterium]|jgi:para-nitrobenzyl esterase|nr:T9SS type A sorting domain-containing protein [Salibacteraceae bacterium]
MKSSLLTVFLFAASLPMFAQTDCGETRYTTRLFTEIDSVKNVTYGSNTSQLGLPKTLKMDVYMPANDALEERPVVLLAFGGSFVVGNRADMRPLCMEYASRGFVTVTIDYRLYDNFFQQPDTIVAYDIVTEAVGDMRAAIRKVREIAKDGNPYAIDTNMIFIGGISAGGIVADHVAYLDENDAVSPALDSIIASNEGLDGNSSDNFQFSSKVSGVLNFSGALNRAYWINAGEPPLFSVHEEFDPTVPYGIGITTSLGTPVDLSGSGAMHPIAEEAGIKNELITIEGSNQHVGYFATGNQTEIYATIIESSAAFLKEIICPSSLTAAEIETTDLATLFPNPSTGSFRFSSLKSQSYTYTILDQLGKIHASGTARNEQEINLNHLSTGVYFVQLKVENEIKTLKWVVQK